MPKKGFMAKVREDRYELLRKYPSDPNRWEQLIAGSLEVCMRHIEENVKYWYDGEEVVLFKVETNHTPITRWRGRVSFEKEDL